MVFTLMLLVVLLVVYVLCYVLVVFSMLFNLCYLKLIVFCRYSLNLQYYMFYASEFRVVVYLVCFVGFSGIVVVMRFVLLHRSYICINKFTFTMLLNLVISFVQVALACGFVVYIVHLYDVGMYIIVVKLVILFQVGVCLLVRNVCIQLVSYVSDLLVFVFVFQGLLVVCVVLIVLCLLFVLQLDILGLNVGWQYTFRLHLFCFG